jgi:hypothetical protein
MSFTPAIAITAALAAAPAAALIPCVYAVVAAG